jgi:hypothetical protein
VAVLAVVGGIAYSVLVNARDVVTEPASTEAVAQQADGTAAAGDAVAATADQAATSQHGCKATCGKSPKSCGSSQSTSCDPSACGK